MDQRSTGRGIHLGPCFALPAKAGTQRLIADYFFFLAPFLAPFFAPFFAAFFLAATRNTSCCRSRSCALGLAEPFGVSAPGTNPSYRSRAVADAPRFAQDLGRRATRLGHLRVGRSCRLVTSVSSVCHSSSRFTQPAKSKVIIPVALFFATRIHAGTSDEWRCGGPIRPPHGVVRMIRWFSRRIQIVT